MITSKSNSKVKQVRALRQRKERDSTGLFVVEGIAHTGAALETSAPIEYLLYAPETLRSGNGQRLVEQAARRRIAVEPVSGEVFESLAEKDNPAGLLAVVRRPDTDLKNLPVEPAAWFVALVSPQDPGNVGTILRTIDAVGASGLILVDGGADAFHPGAVRASLGAIFYRPVATSTFDGFVDWARRSNCAIVGASARDAGDYQTAAYRRPLTLLMGSEQKGLTPSQRSACDNLVSLPMNGRVSSLNLAVATGVLLYSLRAKLAA
jgi:TrmH family RNA methyltransferase